MTDTSTSSSTAAAAAPNPCSTTLFGNNVRDQICEYITNKNCDKLNTYLKFINVFDTETKSAILMIHYGKNVYILQLKYSVQLLLSVLKIDAGTLDNNLFILV